MTDPDKRAKPEKKRARSKNYSRNIGAAERPTFYATPELIDQVEEQRTKDGDSKSALIAKLLAVLLQSEGGQELRRVAAINKRRLVDEVEGYLLMPLELPFYQEMLAVASTDLRDRTTMMQFLLRLGWEEYQSRLKKSTD